MSTTDWNRVKELFHQASERPPEQWEAFLGEQCGEELALRDEVMSLLRTLEASQLGSGESTENEPRDAIAAESMEVPQRLGSYRLIREIGEGGFGTVWLARQERPIAREVAIKMIKPGMDSRSVIARFEQERQSLAMMDHHHIARIFDAGATESGRPYFVMEFVEGEPIVAFARRHGLLLRQKLEMFLDVVLAVHHAHQKGVIHRDLKPSNVLVRLVEGRPEPKVIDFGIAKALGSAGVGKGANQNLTAEQQMIGTLDYMSPEQATGESDLDTRSDIFSLGVLLYELITGTTPLTGTSANASHQTRLRELLEGDIAPPSLRLKQLRTSLAEPDKPGSAENRSEARSGRHRVGEELDWVVMRCLRRERDERYDSADALGADIRRYLAGDVVSAVPPSRMYRMKKFARRHRVGVASTAIFAGCVMTFGWLYVVGMEREKRQTEAALLVAERERAEAVRQKEIAKGVTAFQTDMLASADPRGEFGANVTVLQVMQAATLRLNDGALHNQPDVEAAIRFSIGETLNSLGEYVKARESLERSVALLESPTHRNEILLASSLNTLGISCKQLGDYATAEVHYNRALEIGRVALGEEHPEVAITLSNLASLMQDTNRASEAEKLYNEAIGMFRKSGPAERLADAMNNLASLKLSVGAKEEATKLLEETLDLRRRLYRADHPMVAQSLNNLAGAYLKAGRFAECETLVREALEVRRSTLPAGHPDIANSLANLGVLCYRQGKLTEAEPLLREALNLRIDKLGKEHNLCRSTAKNLAQTLDDLGRSDEAAKLRAEYSE
jgi:serine/threonine protein kinase/tetratricopeptide (TPR) repeat protein